jgi:cell fate regulator YaaT (PSP1 superfamily)
MNEQEPNPAEPQAIEARAGLRYRVKIVHSSATDVYQADPALAIKRGDYVIVPTRYGPELGRVQGSVQGDGGDGSAAQSVERLASREEVEHFELVKHKERQAFDLCRAKIAERGLDMKLVCAHYLVGESKILFYFTAEARVDFRELVKDLVSVFKMRIELRQIGVRDEARVLGGIGVCGRAYCCHSITDKLRAVSIKMAKEQDLTLNSMKISGPCGRLLCCLAYEFDSYRECRRGLPSEGTRVQVNGQTMKVADLNIFSQTVRLVAEDGQMLNLEFGQLAYDCQAAQWRVGEAT